MLSVGIIGLPNVGKSTLFNSLTSGHAAVSNYPFTTIDSNVGVVAVPDRRLDQLSAVVRPKETNPSFIQFTDIAGLVRGASRGEGLGNQFLASIRDVDAIGHVVRCFRDPEVAHVIGEVDPARDCDIIETELLLADLELMDRAIEKRIRTWKTNPRQFAAEESRFRTYREHLAAGVPLRTEYQDEEARRELKGLGILTGKPVFYIANISEDFLRDPEASPAHRIRHSRLSKDPIIVSFPVKLEWELQQLEPEERQEFMKELEIGESGLERVIQTAYRCLGLVTFYTLANQKLSAWAVKEGTPAPVAAGKIHTDMEKGFIRAQVATFDQIVKHENFHNLHRLGMVRTEGRDYSIRDGDIVEFLFSA
jgi:GTP-binding protein YchF